MSLGKSSGLILFFSSVGFISGAAAEVCKLQRFASIPVTLGSRDAILVDVSIDGEPVKLQLDTGAGLSLLDQAFVDRRKLPSIEGGAAYGLTGKAVRRSTRVGQLALGNAVARDAVFQVVDLRGGDGTDGRPVGLLGADFLASHDVEIDLAAARVNLFAPNRCQGQVVYWAKEYFRVPIRQIPGDLIDVEMQIEGHGLHGLIDTGASVTTMRLAVARGVFDLSPGSAEPQAHYWMQGVDGRRIDCFDHRFESLTLGGITVHDTMVAVADIDTRQGAITTGSRITGDPDQPDVIIGMPLLRRLHLYIAYAERSLYFTVAEPSTAH